MQIKIYMYKKIKKIKHKYGQGKKKAYFRMEKSWTCFWLMGIKRGKLAMEETGQWGR